MARSLLIVGAFAPELEPYSLLSFPRTLSLRTHIVGVGPVAAAAGMANRLAAGRPEGVIFSGTCGVYPDAGFGVGDVIVAQRLVFLDGAVASGAGAMPSVMATEMQTPPGRLLPLLQVGAMPADVATVPSVTTSDGLARQLRERSRCSIEHLEAFAVAYACEQVQVPWVIVLGVANQVGPMGRQQWRQYHEAVAHRTADLVWKTLVPPAAVTR